MSARWETPPTSTTPTGRSKLRPATPTLPWDNTFGFLDPTGMGEVYKAIDTRLDRTVAINVLSEHVAADTLI